MSVQQCLIKISSVQAWDVGIYSLGKKRAKHWFQRSSVVQVSIFDHTSDEIVFIELTLGYVCVCPREPGRSQIHKMGDDVKKCYYWRLSPGVARHLNVIEKESLPSHRFFLTKKKKSWCERKREKADYFSSFVAPLDKDEFGSIDWKNIYWLIDKLGDTGTKLKLNRQIELCLSRNGVQLISI